MRGITIASFCCGMSFGVFILSVLEEKWPAAILNLAASLLNAYLLRINLKRMEGVER